MYFSPYVAFADTGGSVDPLGFLRPGNALADLLFRQFTVLSNYPDYHGFLCFAFDYLAATRTPPGKTGFSARVRDIEIFWGLLSLKSTGESLLNVTKLKALSEKDYCFSRNNNYGGLYIRLNYGALGHYTGPSVRWNLINRQITQLTDMGYRLGEAWSRRGSFAFKELADAWLKGDDLFDEATVKKKLAPYSLHSQPARAEKEVWNDVIALACQKDKLSAPLWEYPLRDEILYLATSESEYHLFFPALVEYYSKYGQLSQRISLCWHFEEIAALSQYIFDWEYVRRDLANHLTEQPGSRRTAIVEAMQYSLRLFLDTLAKSGLALQWELPGRLAACSSYAELADAILAHHTSHQNRKGTSPFMDEKHILVEGRVDAAKTLRLHEQLEDDSKRISQVLTWNFKRNWYFSNARRWLEYAGRI